MLYNYIFIFLAFLVDSAINALFPAQFAFESMYFVPCVGLCSMVLSVRKMPKVDGIILMILFGIMYDFFFANTLFFYTFVFILIFGIIQLWSSLVNESIIESLVLCISTIFTKELMVYLFMKIANHTYVSFNTFLTNRLFLTLLVNAVFVFILILLAYLKDDLQRRKEIRIRREERLPWLH